MTELPKMKLDGLGDCAVIAVLRAERGMAVEAAVKGAAVGAALQIGLGILLVGSTVGYIATRNSTVFQSVEPKGRVGASASAKL